MAKNNTPSQQEIESAKQVLKSAGYLVNSMWQKDDILQCFFNMKEAKRTGRVKNLSSTDLDKIADSIEQCFDAEIGINWESIESSIANHLQLKD